MYSLIKKFNFFPTEYATDPLFMAIFGEEFWMRYSGTNAEILMAWLKAGEWPSYKDYDCLGGSRNFFGVDIKDGRGRGSGRANGDGNGDGNGVCCNIFSGYGSGAGYCGGTSDGPSDGNGYCHSSGTYQGGGNGHGDGSAYTTCKQIINSELVLNTFPKVDFTTRFEKEQYVIAWDQAGGCFYGQYRDHCGREVCLTNSRHLWGWLSSHYSSHNVATQYLPQELRVGFTNTEPLLLLSCVMLIGVTEKNAIEINKLPYYKII